MEEQITEYPLFGKKFIKKDEVFGDFCYEPPNRNISISPAIGAGGKSTIEVKISANTPIDIFSNGSEADHWTYNNCAKCKRYNPNLNTPTGIREKGCPLEFRLALAYVDSGKIPFKTVKRIGYVDLRITDNGIFADLTDCKEKQKQ